MKRLFHILIFTIITMCASAQSSGVKSCVDAVILLTTYNKEGGVIAKSYGVFIGGDGTAVSLWEPFKGAQRAVVTDAKGKEFPVTGIISKETIYGFCKFTVGAKHPGASIADDKGGSKVWFLPFAKNGKPQQTNVGATESFMDKYTYYILPDITGEDIDGCPVCDDNGKVVALVQKMKTTRGASATDIKYVNALKSRGMDINDSDLSQCGIPLVMPDDIEEARLMLMLSSHFDLSRQKTVANAFKSKYPKEIDGYSHLAHVAVAEERFDDAKRIMEDALSNVSGKDKAHFEYANMIYQKETTMADKPFPAWSIDKAMEEAQKAVSIDPQPMYRHLVAQIDYVKGDYQKAYDEFIALTKTNMRNPEVFYEAAQSKAQLQGSDDEILALLDSAVSVCPTPYNSSTAQYLLARGMAYDNAGKYRKAVADYNDYEVAMRGYVGADFFYLREQCEAKGRMFQLALNDIEKAIILSPAQPDLRAEKANVLYRVNEIDDAIQTAREVVEMAPDYSDGYLILGLALIQKGDKAEGLQQLEKAKSLGNTQAESLIQKYR